MFVSLSLLFTVDGVRYQSYLSHYPLPFCVGLGGGGGVGVRTGTLS